MVAVNGPSFMVEGPVPRTLLERAGPQVGAARWWNTSATKLMAAATRASTAVKWVKVVMNAAWWKDDSHACVVSACNIFMWIGVYTAAGAKCRVVE